MNNIIYHITTNEQWQLALQQNFYEAESVATEGFMHCSTGQQVSGVLHRYFKGKAGLVKLTIDTTKLLSGLQYDYSPSVNELFPHIYGRLNLDAVLHVEALQ